MSCCGAKLQIHQFFETEQPFYFPGEDVRGSSWHLAVYHPRTMTLFLELAGVASFTPADPDEGVATEGKVLVTFTPDPDDVSTWEHATYCLYSVTAGVRTVRVEGRLQRSRKPKELAT